MMELKTSRMQALVGGVTSSRKVSSNILTIGEAGTAAGMDTTGAGSSASGVTTVAAAASETPRRGVRAIVSGSIFAWRWSFQMQAVNMSNQFSFRGPSTEVEAQHLIRPLGRRSSDPQADQQARNKGCIHLEAHPVDPLAQQMPAAQHTFDPAEKQLHCPPIAIRHSQ